VAAVLAVDVLDDLFAALVLEVDVDVGRLVAFGADETLEEQHGVHLGVDRRHLQAVADGRVRGAAAALAQDALAARPVHDVGDGEEVGLVLQLGDEGELVFEHAAHGRRHTRRITPCGTLLRQHAQPAGGGVAIGHDLARVFVLQLGQRERAAAGQHQRVVQPFAAVQPRQARARTQMRFGVGGQRVAARRHRGAQPRGGQHVEQRLARACVHAHVAGGDDGQAGERGHALRELDQQRVVRLHQQRQCQRGTVAEPGLQPQGVSEEGLERIGRRRRRGGAGRGVDGDRRQHARDHQQGQAARQTGEHGRGGHAALQVGHLGAVLALGRAAPADADPLRQVAVTATRHGQHHQARAAGVPWWWGHEQRVGVFVGGVLVGVCRGRRE